MNFVEAYLFSLGVIITVIFLRLFLFGGSGKVAHILGFGVIFALPLALVVYFGKNLLGK